MILFKKQYIIGFLFGVLIALSAGTAYWLVQNIEEEVVAVSASYYTEAEMIVSLCTESEYRPSCYDEEIPKLMDQGYSMEDAFEVTRIVQEMDETYQYCHVLGHYLSARETAKDPNKWKDVVARAPLGVCSNGSVHGAFQERFRVESFEDADVDAIVPELEGVCEPREGWSPTLMGQATCTHALGHLTMYVTNGDMHDSLELCDRLIESDSRDGKRQLCYDGAFMQIYQPLEPEDIALILGKEIETQEESKEFCSQFDGAYRGSCISESWPLYKDSLKEPETITSICDRAKYDDWQYERCEMGMFYVAMAQANLSVEWAESFCAQLDGNGRDMCYGNSASRLIEVDSRNVEKALTLCAGAAGEQARDSCFGELLKYSAYTFNVGTEEFYELCNGLPEPMSLQCLRQEGRPTL